MGFKQKLLLYGGCFSAVIIFLVGSDILHQPAESIPELAYNVPLDIQIRQQPKRFPLDTNMPPLREGRVSGSIDLSTFSPENDLVAVHDDRVWWESDNDTNDTEDDHMVHKSLEAPLRRVIELVCKNNGTLEVHDSYRETGIHNPKSLHKEGRAVDLTCDDFSMEKLAKICWAAGFDWVLYEKKGGAHIHCSVRRNHNDRAIFAAYSAGQ